MHLEEKVTRTNKQKTCTHKLKKCYKPVTTDESRID